MQQDSRDSINATKIRVINNDKIFLRKNVTNLVQHVSDFIRVPWVVNVPDGTRDWAPVPDHGPSDDVTVGFFNTFKALADVLLLAPVLRDAHVHLEQIFETD